MAKLTVGSVNAYLSDGENTLFYGVPGSGKSHTIEEKHCKKGVNVERVVFHPDYTYSDFVGQLLPTVDKQGKVSYKFTPGPFTKILYRACDKQKEKYILIVEEINRGNAPAIFGDVFQLLDRRTGDDGHRAGNSVYEITNENIALEVYGKKRQKIAIPSNLSILGTMNTSDQNVFPIDTAFQRRWNMRLIKNEFKDDNVPPANTIILDTKVLLPQLNVGQITRHKK